MYVIKLRLFRVNPINIHEHWFMNYYLHELIFIYNTFINILTETNIVNMSFLEIKQLIINIITSFYENIPQNNLYIETWH